MSQVEMALRKRWLGGVLWMRVSLSSMQDQREASLLSTGRDAKQAVKMFVVVGGGGGCSGVFVVVFLVFLFWF